MTKTLYGKSLSRSTDKQGSSVKLGDTIRVIAVDPRILNGLPHDEVTFLGSFIGNLFSIKHINSDGSVIVEKEICYEDIIDGHGLAVFPHQFELVAI